MKKSLVTLSVCVSLFILLSVGAMATVTDRFIANSTSNYTVSHSSSNLLNNASRYNATWLNFTTSNDNVTFASRLYEKEGTVFGFRAKLDDATKYNRFIGWTGNINLAYIASTAVSARLEVETDTNTDVCRGTIVNDSEWHTYLVILNNSQCIMYQDGVKLSMSDSSISNDITLDVIGETTATNGFFNGSINYFWALNSSVSNENINMLILNDQPSPIIERIVTGARYNMWAHPNGNVTGMTKGQVWTSSNSGASFSFVTNFTNDTSAINSGIWMDSQNNTYSSARGLYNLYISRGNINNWTLSLNVTSISNGYCKYAVFREGSLTEDNLGNIYYGVYSNVIDGSDENESCDLIYKSSNYGLTWTNVYNGDNYLGSDDDYSHVHFVQFDNYTNTLYASIGDGNQDRKLIKSTNYGSSWTIVKSGNESGISWQPTSIAFFNGYRIIGEDWNVIGKPNGSGIYLTYDDTAWFNVFNTSSDEAGYFVWMKKDANGYVYAATSEVDNNSKATMYVSRDGRKWYRAYQWGLSGYTDDTTVGFGMISDFDANGYAYVFDAKNSTTAPNSFRFKTIDSYTFKFKFDESTGTTAYDSSGNSNHGTISGATWRNDSNKIRMVATYEYKLNGNQFQLVDPYLDYTLTELDYNCIVPYDNYTISSAGTKTFCDGDYNLVDPQDDGIIKITSSNVIVECNNVTFIGDSASGSRIFYIAYHYKNITIRNCNGYNYHYGIYTSSVNDSSFLNNHFENMTEFIALTTSRNITVSGNTLKNNNSISASNFAIEIWSGTRSDLGYHNITNNIIENVKNGISIKGNNSYTSISFNNISNTKGSGAGIDCTENVTYCDVFNNRLVNMSRNGISFGQQIVTRIVNFGHKIHNNYVENFIHHGIDTGDLNYVFTQSAHNQVYDNTLTQPTLSTDTGSAGIFLTKCANCTATNNYIYNVFNEGISSEGGNYTYQIQIINNTINSTTSYCLQAQNNDTYFSGNTLKNCGITARILSPDTNTTTYSIIKNNYYLDSLIEIKTMYNQTNTFFNESTTQNILVNGTNRISIFNYNGRKDFTVTNYTISWGSRSATQTKTLAAGETFYITDNDCVIPTEDYVISTSGVTKLCGGNIYNLTDSNANGSIVVRTTNVLVDCQGSSIVGNWSTNSRAFDTGINANVSFRNCNISKFHWGIVTTSHNSKVYDNTFNDNSIAGVYTYTYFNISIYNNVFYNSSIYASNSRYNLSVYNNNITCGRKCGTVTRAIRFDSTNNNFFYGKIYNNILTLSSQFGIEVSQAATTNLTDLEIYDNTIRNVDVGILLTSVNSTNFTSFNSKIYNNRLINTTSDYDTYDMGMWIYKSTNIIIQGNNLSEQATTGIGIQASKNVSVSNNRFDFIPFASRSSYLARDINEPITAINIYELYKTWIGNSVENCATDTITQISKYASDNITISGNTFDSDTQVFLKNQGASNVNHDLTNNWNFTYQAPANLVNATTLFINNDFTTLRNFGKPLSVYTESNLYEAYCNGRNKVNLTIRQTSQIFTESNGTNANVSYLSLPANTKVFTNESTPYCNGAATCNWSLSQGNRSIAIVDRFLQSLATSIRDAYSSFDAATNTYTFNCNGTGVASFAGLNMSGSTGIDVYHEGVLYETIQTTSYSTNGSCSSWSFSPSNVQQSASQGNTGGGGASYCTYNSQCPVGYSCVAGACAVITTVQPTASPTPTPAQACYQDAQCPVGQQCIEGVCSVAQSAAPAQVNTTSASFKLPAAISSVKFNAETILVAVMVILILSAVIYVGTRK